MCTSPLRRVHLAAPALRRIHRVLVLLGARRPYAEVSGATRLPRTVRTSLATANRLARAGARVEYLDAAR